MKISILMIKPLLKKSKLVMNCLETMRTSTRKFLFKLSPVLLAKYRYMTMQRRRLNLKTPKSFDEKLLWLMLYWQHPLKSQCGDKYTMRSYVEDHGLGYMLPKLIGVYENSNDIDFNGLPERFVLKCTHGSGFNIICNNKSKLDVREVKRKLDSWMHTDMSQVAGEVHYSLMKHRIICEVYLDDLTVDVLCDYKVFCFNGEAFCTMVCTERGSGNTKFDFYDRDWQYKLPYDKQSIVANRNIIKPEAYEEIIVAAEKLSKPFPFVRVDFYSINGKAVIGEMTFTPNACIDITLTDLAQRVLGDKIELPEKYLN